MRFPSVRGYLRLFILVFLFASPFSPIVAQTVEHGRESAKGQMNFTNLADYYRLHPEPFRMMDLENESDDYPRPAPATADPTKVHMRRPMPPPSGPSSHTVLLPISPSPTDTFESTLDPGTSIPPDTHGAVDSNYCLTTINTTVKIQTKAGGAVSSVSLNAFFNTINPLGGTFDPRVHYDPYSNRWIVVAVSGANNVTDSTSILIGVSKTSNPTGGWWMYIVRAYTPHDYWLDYPDVGFNGKWITVTGNLFQNSPGSGYNGAKVFVFNKASLYSGAGAPFTAFTQPSSFTICPALTYSPTEPSMFCVEQYNSSVGMMRLWKITGAVGSETLTSVGFPTSPNFWQGGSFEITGISGSDFAPQSGSANKLQTNDDRVTQLVQMNNSLWFAHTVFLPFSTTVNATHSSVDWWQIDTFANPIQIGRIDDPTGANFYAFPSLTVNTSDDALIGFSAMSATTLPSSAYALRMHTDPVDSVRPLQIYRHGQATYYKTFSGTKNRWGDYSGTALDPINQTDFWTIQEASASPANTWDTWWAHVKLCTPPAAITGTANVCPGGVTTLGDATGGGTWTSSNTAVATANSGSGDITGVTAGTTVITYTITGGCTATTVLTVNPLPSAISGSTNVCVGSTTTLTDGGGGTWTSSNTAVATVGLGSGIVSGVTVGTTIITYTLGTGCYITTTVTANTAPGAITGTATVCAGATTTLTDAPGGGAWTSSNTAVATVTGTTGIVSGVSAGSSTITYSLGAGCTATRVVTVNTTPSAITGTASACAGAGTTLGDLPAGGNWTSGNTAVATITGVTGIVSAVSAGTSIISYTLGSGCRATIVYTVQTVPTLIAGTTSVCTGATTLLGNGVAGGNWTSSNTAVATVPTGSGLVSGVSAGTTSITYTLPAGCFTSITVTVNQTPAAIAGSSLVCAGFTTSLTDATPGGAWTSSNTAVATAGGTGTIGGVSAGTSIISYTLSGCTASLTVTVTTPPAAISGATSVCSGSTTSLTNSVAGGTWSSSNTAVATAVAATGLVTGVSVGTSVITYSLGGGCFTTITVSVSLGAAPITGTTSACIGGTTSLSDATSGGTWSSSNTAVATVVSGSGLVGGVSAGTSIITYSVGSGCSATTVVTVSPAVAAAVSGPSILCVGQMSTFTDATPGGTWISSNASIATANSATGDVTGLAAGSATITYRVVNSCGVAIATRSVTVSALPVVAAITGTGTVCTGATTTLSDATPSGLWSSSATTIATAGATGIITGVAPGTAAISYTVTNASGCSASALATVTVSTPLMPVITPLGATTFCTGAYVVLSATTGAGYTYQWQRGGTDITGATAATFTASVSGTYTVKLNSGSGCINTSAGTVITVNPTTIVVPSVSIAATPGTSLCATATSVSFSPTPVNGGLTPSYQWFVNGSASGAGATFSYTPAAGDIVKVLLTSSDVCAFPDTASNFVTITIIAPETPAVSLVAAPRDTVCNGSMITLTPVPVFGGSAPTYTWSKNGAPAHTGTTYSYVPVNGDRIVATMTSSYFCVSTPAAVSAPLTVHVSPVNTNAVFVSATSTSIIAGMSDTFVAAAPFGGASPLYQWFINLIAVPGATSGIFITSSLENGDLVTCRVTSSDRCVTPASVSSNGIRMNVFTSSVKTVNTIGGITLKPNPNSGAFSITGNNKKIGNDRVTISVTNMLGQTLYSKTVTARNGLINEEIDLGPSLANGMYLVTVTSGEQHAVFNMVIEK